MFKMFIENKPWQLPLGSLQEVPSMPTVLTVRSTVGDPVPS